MSKTHIIILRESLVESIISDMVTAATTLGLIGIGILLDSHVLQFVGAIMVMLVLVEMSRRIDKQRGHSRRHQGFNDRWDQMERDAQVANGRLLRNYEPAPLSVWEMATQAFAEAHFATFPPELAERCIIAGCPKGGLVLDPFGGAGTTALVALRHGRTASLIELNPEYADITCRRIEKEWKVPRKAASVDLGPLFAGSAA